MLLHRYDVLIAPGVVAPRGAARSARSRRASTEPRRSAAARRFARRCPILHPPVPIITAICRREIIIIIITTAIITITVIA